MSDALTPRRSWWAPSSNRFTTRDAAVLAQARERDEQRRAKRLAAAVGAPICHACRRPL
jgi:hypothetical protein